MLKEEDRRKVVEAQAEAWRSIQDVSQWASDSMELVKPDERGYTNTRRLLGKIECEKRRIARLITALGG
jgi:hypothetical protein